MNNISLSKGAVTNALSQPSCKSGHLREDSTQFCFLASDQVALSPCSVVMRAICGSLFVSPVGYRSSLQLTPRVLSPRGSSKPTLRKRVLVKQSETYLPISLNQCLNPHWMALHDLSPQQPPSRPSFAVKGCSRIERTQKTLTVFLPRKAARPF